MQTTPLTTIVIFGLVLFFLYLLTLQGSRGKGKRRRDYKALTPLVPVDSNGIDLTGTQPKMFEQFYPDIVVPSGEMVEYSHFPRLEASHQTVQKFFSSQKLPVPQNLDNIVFGNGATQLMNAYLQSYSLKGVRNVYLSRPYSTMFLPMLTNLNLIPVFDPKEADLEIVVVPQKSQTTGVPVLYNFALASPEEANAALTTTLDGVARDQFWSVSKTFGLPGTRYGFAFIADPEVRSYVADQILITSRGVGTVGHHIVQQLFEDPTRMSNVITESLEKLDHRFVALSNRLPSTRYTSFYAIVARPAGWFRQRGVVVVSGDQIGLDDKVSRVALTASDEDWINFLTKIK